MKRLLAVLVLCCVCPLLAVHGAEKKATPKKEYGKEGETGTIIGTLVKKERGKITIKGEAKTMMLMPYWHGGSPKDGGGYDKELMKQIETLKVGDKVKVDWKFSEHYRIEKIAKAE